MFHLHLYKIYSTYSNGVNYFFLKGVTNLVNDFSDYPERICGPIFQVLFLEKAFSRVIFLTR